VQRSVLLVLAQAKARIEICKKIDGDIAVGWWWWPAATAIPLFTTGLGLEPAGGIAVELANVGRAAFKRSLLEPTAVEHFGQEVPCRSRLDR
jgi:hypothetical protein